jgi:hypothetical protein
LIDLWKKYDRAGIQLSANDRIALDLELAVGQMTETISVTAESPVLTTATASTGQVIS